MALAVDDDLHFIQQHLLHHHRSAAQHLGLQTGEAADTLRPLSNASTAAALLITILPQERILNKTRKILKGDDRESLTHKQDANEMSVRSSIK